MKSARILTVLVPALAMIFFWPEVSKAAEMGTAFTYQGHLYDANYVANGQYDFQFKLYDANSGGVQLGSDVNKPDVDVIDAYFTVELDFNDPNAFNGDARWLEIGVRPGEQNDPNGYTTLSPLLELTPTPYALYAKQASSIADGISGTANYIPKFTDANTIVNSVIYENNGRIGMGTTNPAITLHIEDDIGGIGGFAGAAGIAIMSNLYGHSPAIFLTHTGTGGRQYRLASYGDNINPGYFSIRDESAATERLVIDHNGNVGIGTTSPNSSKGSGGYLDAKDVYLRDSGKWASELSGAFSVDTTTVSGSGPQSDSWDPPNVSNVLLGFAILERHGNYNNCGHVIDFDSWYDNNRVYYRMNTSRDGDGNNMGWRLRLIALGI